MDAQKGNYSVPLPLPRVGVGGSSPLVVRAVEAAMARAVPRAQGQGEPHG